ncbi:sporulation-specific protein 22 [Neodidymelliopsis sp. IMI 364377]|nr:sporulation-specific protein 22 [Neodidymelliopsis sp. IMI 364377]
MAPGQSSVRFERDMKVKGVLTFASDLVTRLDKLQESALINDLQAQIRHLPLQPSSAVEAKRDELDKLGTELWNLSTRLRRNKTTRDGETKNDIARNGTVCLLRAYAFLLLDAAGSQFMKGREHKPCIRLMKVALKAAKICILGEELVTATKVLERAAAYEEVLGGERKDGHDEAWNISRRLIPDPHQAFRQDRFDMAEHMFAKCENFTFNLAPETAESLADLFFEIGRQVLTKRNYETAVTWLERAFNMLRKQDLDILGPEAGELRLSLMQSLVQAHIELKKPEGIKKASHLVRLMETDYGDKMVVSLLKIELILAADSIDHNEYHGGNNVYACKALDDLMRIRLNREENGSWIEKAAITRIWLSTSDVHAENALEQLQQMFDMILHESNYMLSAPATHAAQTLLWKKVEETSTQEQHSIAESWCRLCLHPLFERAGAQNKVKITRPGKPEQQLFTVQELEWFSRNSYNLSLKHCAEIPPKSLVRLLGVCVEFIGLLRQQEQSTTPEDLDLRLAFCDFLAACTYTTLARAEDSQEASLQYYLEARNRCQEFRRVAFEGPNKLSGAAQDDILSKQLQVIKLELEAALKLQRWDDLDELFEQCWNYKSSDRYETLADLVLVIHSCLVQADVDAKYQGKVLSMLQKIINLTSRQNGNDINTLSRWLRCLFNLTLTYDETISLKCLDQVTQIATKKHKRLRPRGAQLSLLATPPPSSPVKLEDDLGSANEESKQPDRYPATELEWLATSSFNRAVDYYLQDNDTKCKEWAEKAMILAQWLEDDGQLRDLLMGKFSVLQFEK